MKAIRNGAPLAVAARADDWEASAARACRDTSDGIAGSATATPSPRKKRRRAEFAALGDAA